MGFYEIIFTNDLKIYSSLMIRKFTFAALKHKDLDLDLKSNKKITCKWLATFSLVSPGTPMISTIFLGTASAENKNMLPNKNGQKGKNYKPKFQELQKQT